MIGCEIAPLDDVLYNVKASSSKANGATQLGDRSGKIPNNNISLRGHEDEICGSTPLKPDQPF